MNVRHLRLAIFLTFVVFEAHLLIKIFLIKKNVYFLFEVSISLPAIHSSFSLFYLWGSYLKKTLKPTKFCSSLWIHRKLTLQFLNKFSSLYIFYMMCKTSREAYWYFLSQIIFVKPPTPSITFLFLFFECPISWSWQSLSFPAGGLFINRGNSTYM